MKEFNITQNDCGLRLDKFIGKAVPSVPPALAYKFIRMKRIKVNGKRADFAYRLCKGDIVSLYINDEFFLKNQNDISIDFSKIKPSLNIIYEDKNIMLVDKKPGVIVHSDDKEGFNTLINHIKAYLYQNGSWNPLEENSFAPALANRIDRNTGGIVIAAKNAEALRVLNEKIKAHEIKKSYLCLVKGRLEKESGKFESYILKDEKSNTVKVLKKQCAGAKYAATVYKTVKYFADKDESLVMCTLITGRTHQIRAQFAAAGHPLCGDGKYGKTGEKGSYQALYSFRIEFCFSDEKNILSYLNNKIFCVKSVPFVNDERIRKKL